MDLSMIESHKNRANLAGIRSQVLRLARAVDACVSVLCQAVILLTTVVLLLLLSANVAARYLFQEGGIAWISEAPAQLFPWLIAAGIVMAVLRGGHIAVDFAFSVLGEQGGKWLAAVIQLLLIVAYAVLFVVAGDVAAIVASEFSPFLRVPGSWGYYALMFAAAGTVLCSFNILVRVILLGKAGLPEVPSEENPS
jgi:TRAP-type C4-dicarboxylate transport system, small permease component